MSSQNGSVSGPSAKGKKGEMLRIKIDEDWIDLSKWQYSHPGGHQILTHLNNQDATDVFYSLHSKEAKARLARLPRTTALPTDPAPSKLALSFREFRKQLETEGYFDRSLLGDVAYVSSILILLSIGYYFRTSSYFLSIFFLGLGMQQAGWIGHDFVHGRGKFAWWAGRLTGGLVNAFSSNWWSNKHNTHHAYPNTVGLDLDIANDPIFHLWIPEQNKDHWMRKYQHIYCLPVYSFLYVSWRQQSFLYAWERKDYAELALMFVNYAWLATLPLAVSIGSVIFAGFLVAVIVTATHQSEELLSSDRPYDFVRDQFLSTRNAIGSNPVLNWLWGGMQFQLEHHLFPTMPKYYYGSVIPRVRAWAKANDIEYREDGIWLILLRNYETMRKFAASWSPETVSQLHAKLNSGATAAGRGLLSDESSARSPRGTRAGG